MTFDAFDNIIVYTPENFLHSWSGLLGADACAAETTVGAIQ
jgi:hypothetical protein